MSFLSRVFILAASFGLLLPGADLVACRLPVNKGSAEPLVVVSGWDRHPWFRGRTGSRTGEGLSQPGEELRLAKAPTSSRKKG